MNVEVEAAVEYIGAQHPVFARLLNRFIQAAHSQRILGAHIDDALGRAHHVRADDHAFQQRMRIALNLVAVHISAGVSLIGVTDNVLGVGLGLGHKIPLVACEKAGAAASAEPGGLDLFDNAVGAAVDQHLVKSLIAAHSDVFLNVRRIDETAVAQNNLLLPLEERDCVP